MRWPSTAPPALVPKFGNGGMVVTSAGGTDERANSVDIGPKGQIVVAGSSATGTVAGGNFASDFVVARYSSKGALDTKFGNGGIARASFGQPSSATEVLALDDGRVLTSGVTSAPLVSGQTSRFDLALARFTAKGTPDTTFSANGQSVISTADPSQGGVVAPPPISLRLAAAALAPADAVDQALDAFQNTTQGKITNKQGGGALLAGTNDDQTVIIAVVTDGVDLSGTVVVKSAAKILGGAKGSAAVKVSNLGDLMAAGTMDIRFFTSTDQTLGDGDLNFFTLANQKLGLKPISAKGKPKTFKAKFTFPTDLADGTYFILAEINATHSVSELDPNNDTAPTDRTVQIERPYVNLTGPALPGNAKLKAGGVSTLPVTLQNTGNIPEKGAVTLSVTLSADNTLDTNDTTLAPVTTNVSLKPDSGKAAKLKVNIPASVAPGSYFVFVRIDPDNAVAEKNEADNLLASTLASTVG